MGYVTTWLCQLALLLAPSLAIAQTSQSPDWPVCGSKTDLAESKDVKIGAGSEFTQSIAPVARAGTRLNKLLHLLVERRREVRVCTLSTVKQIGPGGISTALAGITFHNIPPSKFRSLR